MKYWSWTGIAILLAVGLMALSMAPAVAESRIVSISSGTGGEGVAVNDNGTIWSWGGQMSDNLTCMPHVVPGLTNVTAVSDGVFFTALFKDDGTVWINDNYPAASDSWRRISEPVRVDGLDNITAISAGHTGYELTSDGLIALKNDGTVWKWENGNKPVRIEGLSDIVAIASGPDHSLALKKDGTVWAWGMNGYGQLGDGTYSYTTGMNIMATGRNNPQQVVNLTSVVAISAGDGFSIALKDDGTVWTWGNNYHGELGSGMPDAALPGSAIPVQVMGLDHIVAVSGGQYWALALRDDGTVWAWGDNLWGMLGDGTRKNNDAPVQVKGLSGIVGIHATGYTYSFALDKYGIVWAWGKDDSGSLGDGVYGDNYRCTSTPVNVPFNISLSGQAIEPSWMVRERPPVVIEGEPAAGGNINYMAAVGDDTLYAFDGDSLLSIDKSGNARWNFTLPPGWHFGKTAEITSGSSGGFALPGGHDSSLPVFMADEDNVYVYAISWDENVLLDPGDALRFYGSNNTVMNKEIIAISRDGKVEWTYPFMEDVGLGDRAHIEAAGDRIYVYHCYNETVLGKDGNVLFSIDNVSGPVSVDGNGFIYSVPAIRQYWSVLATGNNGAYLDFRTPANALEARYPNGTLYWHKDINGTVSVLDLRPEAMVKYGNLPLYVNDTLYVPLKGGVMAFDVHGNVKWSKMLGDSYEMFELMPIDDEGNLYFTKYVPDYPRLGDCSNEIRILGSDGNEITQPKNYQFDGWNDRAYDGVLYTVTGLKSHEKVDHTSLDPATVTAYDLRNGTKLWNYTAIESGVHTVAVSRSNVNAIFPARGGEAGLMDTPGTYSQVFTRVTPAGSVVYIYYRAANSPYPVVYGATNCTYASALIALDRNGGLIWDKPMDSFVTATAVYVPAATDKANNSTIFYNTDQGRVGSIPIVEAAAGLTLLASLALFVKFFLLGSVTRARSRLDNNDNRKNIMAFIRERPGSGLSEISKELGINLGTVRYHLMILGLNHRITAYNDGKFVRYFINSNTYSKEDQMVISLARREPLAGILKALLEKDEATNVELSDALGMPDSAISKYLGELIKKGVVAKNPSPTARGSYSVNSAHVSRVASALRIIDAEKAEMARGGSQQQAESCT